MRIVPAGRWDLLCVVGDMDLATIPALSNLARTKLDHPLAVLGRHSLPVFIAGTILAMIGQVMKAVSPGGLLFDSVLIATGIGLQFGFAYCLEWLRRLENRAARKGDIKLPLAKAELVPVPAKNRFGKAR